MNKKTNKKLTKPTNNTEKKKKTNIDYKTHKNKKKQQFF